MRFFLRRLMFYAVALWGAITLNFLLPRLMPGSPLDGLMARLSPAQLSSNPHMVDNLRAYLGVQKQPFFQAYWHYVGQVFTGNFGISTSNFPTPVSDVIGRTLPYSIVLVGVGFLLAFALGTLLGMLAAWRRAGFNWTFVRSAVGHGALPVLIIVFVYAGGWLLNMRNVMINTIEEDYIGMAHAKGLHDRRVMAAYAGRNAILPPLTGFAAQFGSAVGGLVFIEFVFSYPGVGLTLQQAALGSDYPLTQALLLVLAVCVLVANLIMDLLYVVLDPRVRAS